MDVFKAMLGPELHETNSRPQTVDICHKEITLEILRPLHSLFEPSCEDRREYEQSLQTIRDYEQDIQNTPGEFTCRLTLGYDEVTVDDWYSDIPDELLDLVAKIQNNITSLVIQFNPQTKDWINVTEQTTGSPKLDNLFTILTNAKHVTSFAIILDTAYSREMYKEPRSLYLYCNWVDYVFSFTNAWPKLNDLSIDCHICFDDNSAIAFPNLCDFIRAHASSIKKLHMMFWEKAATCDIVTFWCPILTAIKAIKTMDILSIIMEAPTSMDTDELCEAEQSADIIHSILEEKNCNHLAVLKLLGSLLVPGLNVNKLSIGFRNELFRADGFSFIPIEPPPYLLYRIIHNPCINDIEFGYIYCKHFSPLELNSLNYCLKELFGKGHLNKVKLGVYNWSLSEQQALNMFGNHVFISDLSIDNITIQPHVIGKLMRQIVSANAYCYNVKLVIKALDIWKEDGDKICRAKPYDMKQLFSVITKCIERNSDTLERYMRTVDECLKGNTLEQSMIDIINAYLFMKSQQELTIDVEMVFTDQERFKEMQNDEKNVQDMLEHFEETYVNKTERNIKANVKIFQRAWVSNSMEFCIPSKPTKKEDDSVLSMFKKIHNTGSNMCRGEWAQRR
eukprot:167002_1